MGKKRTAVPLGKPLADDEAALDLLALITPADIEAAQVDAAGRMGRRGRALLEAGREEAVDAAEGVTPAGPGD